MNAVIWWISEESHTLNTCTMFLWYLDDAHHVFVSLFLSERYFIPVFCFLIFNLMDFMGRTVTLVSKWVSELFYY